MAIPNEFTTDTIPYLNQNGIKPHTTVWCQTCQSTFLSPHTCAPPYYYQWSVWCPTCQSGVLTYPHVCRPAVNVDISKSYPTGSLPAYPTVSADKPFTYTTSPGREPPTLETRILQLEARILNQQDFIEQLTNRIEAQETEVTNKRR